MADPPKFPPNQYLIQVSVNLDATGYPTYTYLNATTNVKGPTVGSAGPGDLVAWYVQLGGYERSPSNPPYRLDFHDPSFFKMSSLEVPEGGYSPYLHVRTVTKHASTEYSVTVQGVSPISDPRIQVDPFGQGPLTPTPQASSLGRQIEVDWDGIDGDPASIKGANLSINHPYAVYPGDTVTFKTPGQFKVAVDVNDDPSSPPVPGLTSPFEATDGSSMMLILGTGGSTAAQTVASDVSGMFPLHFLSGTVEVHRSTQFAFVVTAPPAHGKHKKKKKFRSA